MQTNVIYIGRIRTRVGAREETLEVDPGSTVADMLEALIQKHGDDFRGLVFDNGGLASGLNVIVDGLNVTSTVLSDDPGETARLPESDEEPTEVELVLLDAPPSGGA